MGSFRAHLGDSFKVDRGLGVSAPVLSSSSTARVATLCIAAVMIGALAVPLFERALLSTFVL